MRIAICWTGISGYLAACWRALASRNGVALKVFTFAQSDQSNAPFNKQILEGLDCQSLEPERAHDVEHVASLVSAHRPEVVIIAGWAHSAYTGLPFHRSLAACKFVMASDTPRRDTFRQWLGRYRIRRLLQRMDGCVVAGERAWQLMRFMGVDESKLWRGVYGFDGPLFDRVHEARLARTDGWPKQFLYTGRYERAKAIDVLAAAYRQYRQMVTDPWPLICCGQGSMQEQLRGVEGVEDRGFVQPVDQPPIWESAGVFVLPSRYEPWGVVIAEAAYCGLPIICSEACGAAVEIVRSFHNGLLVPTEDVARLARAMQWAHEHYQELPQWGARSRAMGAAFTAERWADRWGELCHQIAGSKASTPS
jgi:glycosyltransferase involved in cell wall biosynthesis